MGKPLNPSLYQINTRLLLKDLDRNKKRRATLDDIPDPYLDNIAALGFDWVWFLGVWQTGEAGRAVSLNQPAWRQEYAATLPDFTDEDVTGSPFAIVSYELHRSFGTDKTLPRLRKRLQKRGLRLMLDFVPNHTALDHPWVKTHQEYYIPGTEAERAKAPHNFYEIPKRKGSLILAHGRDPYFPGWPDTLQLNYRHPKVRKAMIKELSRATEQCDGVRCDMAMLLLPDVFAGTWGNASLPADGTPPDDSPFWPAAIDQIRKKQPECIFMAEVYWDLEWKLQQQGFNYTYDKRLYDRLHARDAVGARLHLCADADFQRKSVRFMENHDEPRAAQAFPDNVHQAAAIVSYLVSGLRFFHEGQLDGRRIKASLHLGRRPDEPADANLLEFYRGLLTCLQRPEVRDGNWRLLLCRPAWEGNLSSEQFICFAWDGPGKERLLVTVNYAASQGQCYVKMPFEDLPGKQFLLQDLMSSVRYERNGDNLASNGLYLDMPEWGYHVFEMTST